MELGSDEAIASALPAAAPQLDSFKEALHKAISAATITQSAKSQDDGV
jgi:hypothetical protein